MKRFCSYCRKPTKRRNFSRNEAVSNIDRTMVGLLTFGMSEAAFAFVRTKYTECQRCGAVTKR